MPDPNLHPDRATMPLCKIAASTLPSVLLLWQRDRISSFFVFESIGFIACFPWVLFTASLSPRRQQAQFEHGEQNMIECTPVESA